MLRAIFFGVTLVFFSSVSTLTNDQYDQAYADGKALSECAGSLRAMAESKDLINFPKVRELANDKANLWELAAMVFIASSGRLDSKKVVKYISESTSVRWGATIEVEGAPSHRVLALSFRPLTSLKSVRRR